MKTVVPAREARSPYITREGAERLREELLTLLRDKRPEVTAAVAAAAALGDRSENAEYIYGKKQLREIDRRIRFLEKRLQEVKVIDQLPADRQRVFFAAWVTLEDDHGEQHCYRLVGPDEIDADRRYISIDSPLARALVKKALDDELSVRTPAGETHYVIVAIAYGASPESSST
ncbi:transcription elongation factor GreB [Permianibacter sp. IMCC34836]|uniref:transcription elongation factor GreB n=1 Tax=Permianibacter fluminis TaxID=2738515 RepID=UPI0015542E60|nr:transcription elongation factor GreB [Permianibacter fluminis]NQD38970.1 transcription elongation factor GreB [Permianibacter fluminis]